MISSRLAIPAVLTAAAVAGCLTYLIGQPIAPVEVDQRLQAFKPTLSGPDTTAPTSADKYRGGDEKAAIAYLEAAQAILRRTQASAHNDEPPITGRIPLPKKRPIRAHD